MKTFESSLKHWFLVAVMVSALSTSVRAAIQQGPLVGKKAPAFQVAGIHSETYSLETYKGHILVMQFGASW